MNKKSLCALVSLACITAGAATNYDLLGRKASKMNSPMVYKDVEHKAVKKNTLQENDLLAATYSSTPAYSGVFYELLYKYNLQNGSKHPYLHFSTYDNNGNEQTVIANTAADYFSKHNTLHTPVLENKSVNPTIFFGNQTQTSGYKIDFYTKSSDILTRQGVPATYSNKVNVIYDHIDDVDVRSLSNYAFWYNSYSENLNNSVGMYTKTNAYPAKKESAGYPGFYVINRNVYTSCQSRVATVGDEEDATKFHFASNNPLNGSVYNFFFNSKCETESYPQNPDQVAPQIYLGLHAEHLGYTTQYSARAQELDNYIYNNHTVEIEAAGDNGRATNGSMRFGANAANAITVGSVNKNNDVETYSSWANAPYGAQKPEIVNYTNYASFNKENKTTHVKTYTKESSTSTVYTEYEGLDGTAGAAVYTAKAVSTLLKNQPFMRYHPEVVKARLITASAAKIMHDEHYSGATGIPVIPAILGSRTNMTDHSYVNTSYFWYGDVTKMFTKNSKTGKYELRIPLTLESGYKYRVAIAWLSSGDDIAALNKIPQDFDLSILKKSNDAVLKNSATGTNPYELVTYTATSTESAILRILLYNDATAENNPRHNKIKLGMNILKYKDSSL